LSNRDLNHELESLFLGLWIADSVTNENDI
jgi:hypothetical protein